MRLMFVYWQLEDAGSAQTIANYARAAPELGHEVVLYGPDDDRGAVTCSSDVGAADVVIFLLEWNIYLHQNHPFPLEEPLRRSRREQRVIVDDDGMYNDRVAVGGDYNHPAESDSHARIELYDSIADHILQPSLHPLRPNVHPFLFHGYSPDWEVPLDFTGKDYGMVYVGSNWFRWRALRRVLEAIQPVRADVGPIAVAGHGWNEMPWWVAQPLRDDAYFTDPDYLRALDIELRPAVPIDHVVKTMSLGVFNPVLVRPTFNHLRLVNPRLFETAAANTVPLFGLDSEHVRAIYGDAALELVLSEDPTEQILDVLKRPERYRDIIEELRRHLARHHSFTVRVREFVSLCQELVVDR
jgi:glycosyltransferase involved in cell wall biosynthesis